MCEEKPATVHLTEVVGDNLMDLDLCDTCAKSRGGKGDQRREGK
jgi:protein-arginine kinase activator protein McsA